MLFNEVWGTEWRQVAGHPNVGERFKLNTQCKNYASANRIPLVQYSTHFTAVQQNHYNIVLSSAMSVAHFSIEAICRKQLMPTGNATHTWWSLIT